MTSTPRFGIATSSGDPAALDRDANGRNAGRQREQHADDGHDADDNGPEWNGGHVEARIACLNAKLNITDAQQPLWDASPSDLVECEGVTEMPHELTRMGGRAPCWKSSGSMKRC